MKRLTLIIALIFATHIISFAQGDMSKLVDKLYQIELGASDKTTSNWLQGKIVSQYDDRKIDLSLWDSYSHKNRFSLDYIVMDSMSYDNVTFKFNNEKLASIEFIKSYADDSSSIRLVQTIDNIISSRKDIFHIATPIDDDDRPYSSITDELNDKYYGASRHWAIENTNKRIELNIQRRIHTNEDDTIAWQYKPDMPQSDIVIRLSIEDEIIATAHSDMNKVLDSLDQIPWGLNSKELGAKLQGRVVESFDKTPIDLSDWQRWKNEDRISLEYFDLDNAAYEFAGFDFHHEQLYGVCFVTSHNDYNTAYTIIDRLEQRLNTLAQPIQNSPDESENTNKTLVSEIKNELSALKQWKINDIRISISVQKRMLDNRIPIWKEDGTLEMKDNPDGPDSDMTITISVTSEKYSGANTSPLGYTKTKNRDK